MAQASATLQDRRILVCVCGGIAAYKVVELVRRLRDAGAQVQVAMTDNALRFVGAPSFHAASGQAVRSSLWDAAAEAAMGHIELARWADSIVVAPATANTIARLAYGLADDLVTTLCLATTAPILLAPAMNHRMWAHAATQANLATLRARGMHVIGPEDGAQACGEFGPGRLSDPEAIVAALAACIAAGASPGTTQPASLRGRRIVVSAGPTFEDLDPVRYLGNRSSGKMGFALAAAAARRGADVLLVAGPVNLPTPPDVQRIDVRSAAQLRTAVLYALPADAYIGAAAVADYAPRAIAAGKIKKGAETVTVELVRTADVLAEVAAHAQRPRLVVGFAAETQELERHARAKLEGKQLDLIAANRVGVAGSGFGSDDNALTVYWPGGERALGPGTKTALAEDLIDIVAQRFESGGPGT